MIQASDLSGNHFTGDIPSSIGGCSKLEHLNLSWNSLHGHMPSALADMKGIESIDLSSNNLFGYMPASLGSLHYLQFSRPPHESPWRPCTISWHIHNTTAISILRNTDLNLWGNIRAEIAQMHYSRLKYDIDIFWLVTFWHSTDLLVPSTEPCVLYCPLWASTLTALKCVIRVRYSAPYKDDFVRLTCRCGHSVQHD